LGVIVLVNAIVLTVRLGRRELAIHRALGFTRSQVVGAHLWQGALTAFVGVAVGDGAGFVIGRAIARKLVQDVGAIPETALPPVVWLVTAVACVTCLCAAAVSGVVALCQRPVAALRAE
jgi:ABC-type lipoprotein release transport system permease subunit